MISLPLRVLTIEPTLARKTGLVNYVLFDSGLANANKPVISQTCLANPTFVIQCLDTDTVICFAAMLFVICGFKQQVLFSILNRDS